MSDSPPKVPSPLPGPKGDPSGAPVGRRVLLGMLGLGALGVAAGGPIQDVVAKGVDAVAQKDPTGLSDLLPGNRFRYYTVTSSTPEMDETTYRLQIGGMVDKETTFRLSDLAALPQTRLVRDVQCVTGWRVPKTPFAGVRLSTLLDAVGVSPKAKAIRFSCFDGAYTESLTLEQARHPEVLVATSMEDKPVTHAHGGPVRLYVAPMYFYKSAKWLSGINVTDQVIPGYWEHRGYDVDAWVGRSNGRSDAPTV
ncbi:molybdopterin-dependent oxidoreductase [Streptomyces sp. ME03-5684b]|uniref:molybdopterin-dependent oxidoreductase n=1 Tax=Streptomyces sp. ME03-5684b TaxID=3028681 RepID=UPI0029BBFDB6|nr:molybdopterin-dependent oxidoreductase [Streptomyces sp. ME03-5684b]MDX3319703.1 molybdopterin-dependent oxidoreductase [Streptomyces sp. ME03-5684b]